MVRSRNIPKELSKLNIKTTVIAILICLILFFIDKTKSNFTWNSGFACGFIFFLYFINLLNKLRKNLSLFKTEVLYINYPVKILTFLVLLSLTLLASTICLVMVNKDAANLTFIFTFFMSTVSMLMPLIFLLVIIHFAVPAFVIPNIKSERDTSGYKILLIVFFLLFLFLSGKFAIDKLFEYTNFDKQVRFKASRLTVSYSTNFLKLVNISEFGKRDMSFSKIKVPFIYTTDSQTFDNYQAANIFCDALDAKIPNYLEAYHIVFNRFDTFGEKYYWTSNTDGRYPLVLHFKNMSYEIIRKPDNVKPELYCVTPSNDNFGLGDRKVFVRDMRKENKESIENLTQKPFNTDFLKNLNKIPIQNQQVIPPPVAQPVIAKEKKHVNFSVKEVPQSVFNQLIQAGYTYSPSATISKNYEISDSTLVSIINKNTNNIRLCYYPFADYGDMGIFKEKEIWQQSFCSPSFDVVSTIPVMKTRYEKDSFCMSQGGRLPNIPELAGILKSLGLNQQNVRFWTNHKVKDTQTNATLPVYVYYKDARFMRVVVEQPSENDKGYVFCVKKSKNPSSVIANYKSRFASTDGKFYARMQCPSCNYYEVPDVILQQ